MEIMYRTAPTATLALSGVLFVLLSAVVLVVADQNVRVEKIAGHEVLRSFSDAGGTSVIGTPTRVIFQDKVGSFWLGGYHGLCCYDEKRDKWINHSNAFGTSSIHWVRSIGQDKRGRIWVSYRIECRFAVFDGGHWRSAEELLPANIKSLGQDMIVGTDGRIWFATPEGLIVYDGSTWTGPFKPPEAVLRDFMRLDLREFENDAPAPAGSPGANLPRFEVWSGLQDRAGSIWLGGKEALLRFNERSGQWEVYPTLGLVGQVSMRLEDRLGRIWVADAKAHLAVYDKAKNVWASYDLSRRFPQVRPNVDAVYVDKRGQVLIGTEVGLLALDERTKELIRPNTTGELSRFSSDVTAIQEDRNGRIWIATGNGVSILRQ